MTFMEKGEIPKTTPEQELKFLRERGYRNLEITKLTEFHTDEDVKMKLNQLRILGAWPVPDIEKEGLAAARAYLKGFNEGIRQTIKIGRSGGIS